MEYCLLFSTYIWCSSGCIFLEDFHFDAAVADLQAVESEFQVIRLRAGKRVRAGPSGW